VLLIAGQPSALSVVTLHENQRLKVQSACSDVSSEDYSKYFDVPLTVQLSITLDNDQLDAHIF
jgi:hypothetical protein